MGIGKELFIFLLAVLAGAIVRLAYRCISCLREVVHHAHWVIELEDLIYWIGTVSFSCDYGKNLSENCTAA